VALLCSSRSVAGAIGFKNIMPVTVEVIPMFSDNYAYVVIDKESKQAAVVDPGEGQPVITRVKEMEVQGLCRLTQLWCTHKHSDHAGGNEAFKAAFPSLLVIGTQHEPIPALTQGVTEGSSFTLGSTHVRVFSVPCHTAGHVAFVVGSGEETHLFPGDTLFVGGCGRFFEGTGENMLKNMDRFEQELNPQTLVYPAHEYTESNYKFLANLDPEGCGAAYEEVKEKRRQGLYTVPTTIEKELSTNLFMKCREARVQALVGTSGDPEATMNALRQRKNNF
jgi:hydroxyacylglutathione hydrolase